MHLAAQVVRGEGIAALSLQQDGDGGEGAEDVEQLLVGGVVGQEVAQVDVAERRGGSRERGAPSAGDGDVLRRVLRGQAAAVQAVVERRDRLAQLPHSGDRRIFLIVDVDGHLVHARRRAGQFAGLGLALAQVGPVRIARAVAPAVGLGSDVDDARPRHGAEGGDDDVVRHRRTLPRQPPFQVAMRPGFRQQGARIVHLSPGIPEQDPAHAAVPQVVHHALAERRLPVGHGLQA